MTDISQLTRSKPTPAVIDLGDGDIVNIVFDRAKVSPAWTKDAEARDEAGDSQSIPKALADVVLSWDVTSGEEEFPPSSENLARLNYAAQAALLEQILVAARPSSEEGNDSPEVSKTPPAASTSPAPESQNGTTTTSLDPVSASPSPT